MHRCPLSSFSASILSHLSIIGLSTSLCSRRKNSGEVAATKKSMRRCNCTLADASSWLHAVDSAAAALCASLSIVLSPEP
jgi:hypothetical protein